MKSMKKKCNVCLRKYNVKLDKCPWCHSLIDEHQIAYWGSNMEVDSGFTPCRIILTNDKFKVIFLGYSYGTKLIINTILDIIYYIKKNTLLLDVPLSSIDSVYVKMKNRIGIINLGAVTIIRLTDGKEYSFSRFNKENMIKLERAIGK